MGDLNRRCREIFGSQWIASTSFRPTRKRVTDKLQGSPGQACVTRSPALKKKSPNCAPASQRLKRSPDRSEGLCWVRRQGPFLRTVRRPDPSLRRT